MVRPGDRVVTSGRAGTLLPDLLIGQVVRDRNQRLRVKLAAEYERLKFVRVLRDNKTTEIDSDGSLILPKSKRNNIQNPDLKLE